MGLIDYKTVFFLLDLDVSMIIDYPSSSSMGHGEIPYRPMDGGLKYVFFLIIYPLENAYITMDIWTNGQIHHFLAG